MNKEKQIEEMAELLIEIQQNFNEYCAKPCRACELGGVVNCENHYKANALYNAGYRRQSENVIELPCKIGDEIWYINKKYTVQKAEVTCIYIRSTSRHIIATRYVWETEETIKLTLMFERLNVDYWLTKEEAEKALAKMKGGAE